MSRKLLFVVPLFAFQAVKGDAWELCSEPSDLPTMLTCEISKKTNIPPEKVGMGILLYTSRALTKFCGFTPTKKYKSLIEMLSKDQEAQFVYQWMFDSAGGRLVPPEHSGSKRSFCDSKYEILGPAAGPDAMYYMR